MIFTEAVKLAFEGAKISRACWASEHYVEVAEESGWLMIVCELPAPHKRVYYGVFHLGRDNFEATDWEVRQ